MRRMPLIAALLVAFATTVAQGTIPPELEAQLKAAGEGLQKAATFLRTKKFAEAKTQIAAVEATLAELKQAEGGKELAAPLAALEKRLAAAQKLLEAKSNPSKKGKSTRPTGPAADGFIKAVAPVLVRRCAGCHIRDARGGFSVATYADLIKGSDAGVVFQPGKSQGSRLMDLLESGEMPRGSGRLPTEELATIAKWIDAGGKFDGPNPAAPLVSLVPDAPAEPAQEALRVIKSSGNEQVQFVRDLAPVLVEQCFACHGGTQPAARLNLETFAGLLAGNNNGQIIVPGKPAESQLIKKLRGTAASGARMPLQREPLPEATIAKFETWLTEGARFDGPDAAQNLDQAVKVLVAAKMSHDELAAMRSALAEQHWKLANPDAKPQRVDHEQFVILGKLPPVVLDRVAQEASRMQARVATSFKASARSPFLKGKLTMFVFNRRFDYSEFGRMVEKRELPDDWRGHWRYDVVDAYACVLVPSDQDESLQPILAEQFAGLYIDSQGALPRWFTSGAARALAAKLLPRDPLVKRWEEDLKVAIGSARSPDGFLDDPMPAGDNLLLSFGFARSLMSRAGKYQSLLKQVREGQKFDQAFVKAFGADPKAILKAWGGVSVR